MAQYASFFIDQRKEIMMSEDILTAAVVNFKPDAGNSGKE